jgi:multicomponent Na+:H+ antiporter subunit D
MSVSIILLAMITLTIGFFPEPFFQLADQAAHELMNPSLYIEKVLGGTP